MATTTVDTEQACRIAVIQAWTHDASGEMRCRVVKSEDDEADLESIDIVGLDDAVAWFEQWLSEFQYD